MYDVRHPARWVALFPVALSILALLSLACGGTEPTPPAPPEAAQASAAPPDDASDPPPRSDTITAPTQFLVCKGNAYALCYYSGPLEPPTGTNELVPPLPCKLDDSGNFANCKCYALEGGKTTNYVSLPSILNPEVRQQTIETCHEDGTGCVNMINESDCTNPDQDGCATPPVCDTLGDVAHGTAQSLDPNATLISTFSMVNSRKYPISSTGCDGTYAGCMTAGCGDPYDGADGQRFVDCSCPTYTGVYQFGQNNPDLSCDLEDGHVWSAANVTFPMPVGSDSDG